MIPAESTGCAVSSSGLVPEGTAAGRSVIMHRSCRFVGSWWSQAVCVITCCCPVLCWQFPAWWQRDPCTWREFLCLGSALYTHNAFVMTLVLVYYSSFMKHPFLTEFWQGLRFCHCWFLMVSLKAVRASANTCIWSIAVYSCCFLLSSWDVCVLARTVPGAQQSAPELLCGCMPQSSEQWWARGQRAMHAVPVYIQS